MFTGFSQDCETTFSGELLQQKRQEAIGVGDSLSILQGRTKIHNIEVLVKHYRDKKKQILH